MNSHNFIDLTGKPFGRWTVLEFVPTVLPNGKAGQSRWRCRCKCGTVKVRLSQELRIGATLSCGCLKRELAGTHSLTHGHTRGKNPSREYRSWEAAKGRCLNPNSKDFKEYGGRGISMCGEWRNSFESFLRDMGPCPKGMTLDRFPNNATGNYEPGNCRWATSSQQARNTRGNRLLTFDGRTMTATEWALFMGLPSATLSARINLLHWSIEKALTTPL